MDEWNEQNCPIHHMWLDKKDKYRKNPPESHSKYWRDFEKLGNVTMWNYDMVEQLFDNTPELKKYKKRWESRINWLERCDIARYAVMYVHGGIYIDLDFHYKKDIRSVFGETNKNVILVQEPKENSRLVTALNIISNGMLFSRIKRHLFWISALDISTGPRKKKFLEQVIFGSKGWPVNATGPMVISKLVYGDKIDEDYGLKRPPIIHLDVHILSCCYFFTKTSSGKHPEECSNFRDDMFSDNIWSEGTQTYMSEVIKVGCLTLLALIFFLAIIIGAIICVLMAYDVIKTQPKVNLK
jgi:hypothetical protein